VANGDGANTLTVVGNPDKIISGDYTPIAAANSTLFLKNGRTLYHIPVAGGELTELCTLDSDIRRAFPANGYLIIVTDAGTYRAYYDKATATWQAPLLQGVPSANRQYKHGIAIKTRHRRHNKLAVGKVAVGTATHGHTTPHHTAGQRASASLPARSCSV
jgi:hypothetical protein